MRPDKKLTEQFNKFVGHEVKVIETPRTAVYGGKTYHQVDTEIADGDHTIGALRRAAQKAGFSLRVLLPRSRATMDFRKDRLNVHVAKESDGKYRVQKNIGIG